MAAKLARLVYRMLRYGMKYMDKGAAFYEAQHRYVQINQLKLTGMLNTPAQQFRFSVPAVLIACSRRSQSALKRTSRTVVRWQSGASLTGCYQLCRLPPCHPAWYSHSSR